MDEPPVREEQTSPSPAVAAQEDDLPEPMKLPRWIAPAIALLLVTLAALAIYTGLRYRRAPLGGVFPERAERPGAQTGAPGAPEPGASRMLHGEGGENVPSPGAPIVGEKSRVSITNDPAGMAHSVRLRARRGVLIDVEPSDATVYVNNQPIGIAGQYKNPDEIYEFSEEGGYDIRIAAPGHREVQYIVTSTGDAAEEVAVIRTKLEPQ